MTREEAKKLLSIIQEWEEGKSILSPPSTYLSKAKKNVGTKYSI